MIAQEISVMSRAWTIILIALGMSGAQQTFTKDYHALGYVLRQLDTVHVYNVEAQLTFIISLPERVKPQEFDYKAYGDIDQQLGKSSVTRPIANQIFQMRHSMLSDLQSHIDMIYSMVDSLEFETRQVRSESWVPNWLTHMFSSLTGLAETDDLRAVRQAIEQLESMISSQSETFAVSQHQLSQVMKLQSSRIEALHQMANMSRDSIALLQATIEDLSRFESSTAKLLTRMMEYLSNFTKQRVEIETLHNSIQTLFSGHIPVQLVSTQDMQTMISSLRQYLVRHNPHLAFVTEDLLYYYRQARFFIIRHKTNLLLHVIAPLSSVIPHFKLFSLVKIPLAIPGTAQHYTMLGHPVKAIAFGPSHYFEIPQEMDLSKFPRYLNINRSPIAIQDRHKQTCTTALYDGDLQLIRQFCPYHVFAGPLPTTIVRLSPTKIFVSNVSSLVFDCDGQIINKSSALSTPQAVIVIPCACDLLADHYVIPRSVRTCATNDSWDTNVTYTINLMYLSHFFPMSDIRSIFADTVFQFPPNISVPPLPINSVMYHHQLAISQQAKFDLETIINATKSQKDVFSSIGHVAFQHVIDLNQQTRAFNLFSFRDWLLLLLCLFCLVLFISIAYLRVRLQALAAVTLLASRPMTTYAANIPSAFALQYTFPATPSYDYIQLSDLTSTVAELIPIDVTLLLMLCVIGLLYVINRLRQWYHRYFPNHLTSLLLQIGNMNSSICIPWGKFVHPHQFYNFSVQKNSAKDIRLTLTHHWFGFYILELHGIHTMVSHKILDLHQTVGKQQLIFYFTARPLKQLLIKDHFIAFIVQDSEDNISSCMKLQSFNRDTCQSTAPSSSSSLHPSLDTNQQP